MDTYVQHFQSIEIEHRGEAELGTIGNTKHESRQKTDEGSLKKHAKTIECKVSGNKAEKILPNPWIKLPG